MAKKPMPSKAAAKKAAASIKKPAPAVKSKPVAAKPAVKAAAKKGAKPAPARPASAKPATRPAAKAVSKPAPKALPKPAPKAVEPVKAAPVPVPEPEIVPEPVIEAAAPPPPLSTLPKTVPLTVNVQTSQGLAANGNLQPANLLVIVTCAGWPVTELDKNHFTLMEHFEVPGQAAPFSNSITTFRNAGTGAYLLQTKPINGAPWRTGHHLGQLLVSNSEDQQGQAAFKIIIR
ncbi:hypothetical protein WJU23_03875 [Prosthecobacter sp. SYSU 5D2]|uniref:hypothetical protein n=1 Tax=Prosthecobacter sp. SYSU 5D2 TaxID=3134134 RepID=UPI0031FEA561